MARATADRAILQLNDGREEGEVLQPDTGLKMLSSLVVGPDRMTKSLAERVIAPHTCKAQGGLAYLIEHVRSGRAVMTLQTQVRVKPPGAALKELAMRISRGPFGIMRQHDFFSPAYKGAKNGGVRH